MVTSSLQRAGHALKLQRYRSLGDLILDVLERAHDAQLAAGGNGAGAVEPANVLVRALVDRVPGFADRACGDGA